MRLFITLIAWIACYAIQAQETNRWIGGAFGNETEWHEARNWSLGFIPNEDTKVVIEWTNSGHDSQPVISENAEAASVECRTGSKLQISPEATLTVNSEDYFSEGISLFGGKIDNRGSVVLENMSKDVSRDLVGMLTANGKLETAEPSLTINH